MTTLLHDRLARIETDETLRYTAVRWHAHEAVYPGSGALTEAARYRQRDAEKLAEVEACLAEFAVKLPDDEVVPYLRWLRDELRSVA